MPVFGYARLSTERKALDTQLEALRAAGCTKIFREKVGGAAADRAQLRRAIGKLAAGDVLMVTRLDRLARSTRDLVNILDTIAGKGAGFRSLEDSWADTTTPHGRPMITAVRAWPSSSAR